ncbi:hypothetical protein BpHYR1_039548 [Brachionus plicatilis]|uniref:Uncharacterized protein n=1 Tax=Brachionus plicatilis TaxID=10195 RepID=A0A3M7QVA5_BRAPC|nr:hypothetical protein BpHYR1_039548 [Brachionus plicatilis]
MTKSKAIKSFDLTLLQMTWSDLTLMRLANVIVLISKKFSFVSFTRQEDGSIEGEILVIVIDDTFLIEPEGKSDACEIEETRGGVISSLKF